MNKKGTAALESIDKIPVSYSSLRVMTDKFSEFLKKIWFLENCVSEFDSFHKNALEGWHFVFMDVLDDLEDLEKMIDSVWESSGKVV